MKKILTILFFFTVLVSLAQEPNFHVTGIVKNSTIGKPEAGVSVVVIQKGATILQTTSASNGKYDLRGAVDFSVPFDVVFKKDGLYSKKIAIDVSKINPEDFPAGDYEPWSNTPVELISKSVPADLSFLEIEPVIKIGNGISPELNVAHQTKMKNRIDNALAEAESKKVENEAKYQAAIKEADNLYLNLKKYEAALAKYEDALNYKPKEKYPNDRILELDALIQAKKKDDLVSQQADSEYLNFIKSADALRDQKKYDLAIAKYKEAIEKKDEQYPKDQIKILENENIYQEALKLADMFYNQKSYQAAKEKYLIANKSKPTEQHPITRLADIEKKLGEQTANQEKKKKYDDAIALADQLFGEEKWTEAKTKYEEALVFESAATYPIERIKSCDSKLLEIAKEKEKADKIIKLLAEGNILFTSSKWNEAKSKYSEVLVLDANNVESTQKLEEIAKKLEELNNKAAQEAKFNKLVSEGDIAFKGTKYSDAKLKYEEALLIKVEAPVQVKLDDVNKKIKEQQDKEALETKFQLLKSEGLQFSAEEKWLEAKEKLVEAQLINKMDALVNSKLKEVESKILANQAALAKEKEKADKIVKLLSEGNTLFSTSKWNDAKLKYDEVLVLDLANEEAKIKLTEISVKLEEAKNIAAQEAKFNKLVSDGDLAVKAVKYAEAKQKYEEALVFRTEASVQLKLDDVNKKIQDLLGKEALETQFQTLKEEGMKLASDQKWEEAKSKLTEAQTIKIDVAITSKLKEIEAKIQANEALLKLEKEYQDIILLAQSNESSNNIDGAIAKYKEALLKKPGEQLPKDKISELELLKQSDIKKKEIEAKYIAYMQKGDDLVTAQNYLEAIKEFNAANALKPEATEPVTKAKAAEELEKNKGSEEKKNYEKILNVAEKSINEKDYEKAKGLLDRAKNLNKQLNIVPNDLRADNFLAKISVLELQEKNYKTKMDEAEKYVTLKEYQKAIISFEQAKVIKLDELKPQERIDELKKLIAEQSSQLEKDVLYKDYMTKGSLSQKAKSYEQALSHFENALSVKENDQTAKDKIAELQQILDDIANASKNEIEKKNSFNSFLISADKAFEATNYSEAKLNYEKALDIDPSSIYAKKQIEESIKRERLNELSSAEAEYSALIKAADDFFKMKSYDRAKEEYTNAQILRPLEEHPIKKLKEIDAILNPVIVKSNSLQDLGEPYDNSIMDGYAALVKADVERKNNKSSAVRNRVNAIRNAENDLTGIKTGQQIATTNEIYQIQNKIAVSSVESDLNRQLTVDELNQAAEELAKEARENNAYKYSDNLNSQEALNLVVKNSALDYTIREDVYTENSELLTSYNKNIADGINQQSEKESSSNISTDQQLIEIQEFLQKESSDNFSERKTTEEEVKRVLLKAADITAGLNENKTNLLLNTKADIETVEILVGQKAQNDSKSALSNKEQLNLLDSDIVASETKNSALQNENSSEINKKVDQMNTLISEESTNRDLNRLETTKIIHDGNNSIEAAAYVAYKNETVKYLQNENQIQKQVNVNNGVNELADESHAINVSNIELLDKKANTVSTIIEKGDDEQRSRANSQLDIITTNVGENSIISSKKQESNASKMNDGSRAIDANNTNDEAVQKDKHYENQTRLNNIESKPPEKVKLANSLGQEYPEGVSQESFTQNDENGLMTAVITRRVVVINGNGNTYVRTQTLYAVTYSKNGNPTTEVLWQKETQGPHLKKNY
jgi:hypothetical protein